MVMGAYGVTFCFAVRLPAILNNYCLCLASSPMQKGSGCVCFTRDLKTAFRRMPTERIFYGLFTGSLFVAIKQGLAWLKQKRRAGRNADSP